AQRVDHVVLVPVERLQHDQHTVALGVLAEDAQRLGQHLAVLLGAARRGERRQPEREPAPGGRGHDADAAQLADDRQLGAELLDGVRALGRVEVADEVRHVDADGRHDHAVGLGAFQLGETAREVEVALAPELDGVEPGLDGEGELLLQRPSRQELLLGGELHCDSSKVNTSWSTSDRCSSMRSKAAGASSTGTTWLTRSPTSSSPRCTTSMKVRWSRSTSHRCASQEATPPIWEETSC